MEQNKDVLYQVSLLQGLTNGDYYGSVPVTELKQHGDTGIGTFNKLNGELIMLDGGVYRAAGDGSVEAVSDEETIPFSIVTLAPRASKPLICWSIGRTPKSQPPGGATRARFIRPSKAPRK